MLGWAPPTTNDARIRTLAASARAGATGELCELSLAAASRSDADTLLLAVRALGERAPTDGSVRVLDLHFRRPPALRGAPELRRLVRATAALALGRSRHPRALRALLFAAARQNAHDPELFEVARLALRAEPPPLEDVGAAVPWLSPSEQIALLSWLHGEAEAEEAARRARCDGATQKLQELPALAPARAAELLSELATCPIESGPGERLVAEVEQKSLLWGLRARLVLGLGLGSELVVASAWRALASADATLRAAAAALLAATNDERAASLFRDPRSEVRDAARNEMLARGATFLEAEASTSELWRALSATAPELRWLVWEPLASRVQAAEVGGLGPTPEELLAVWRVGGTSERMALAAGLGRARPATWGTARGLLERLYRSEVDAGVRRVICVGLAKTSGTRIATLDPDAHCRALAEGRPLVLRGARALATWSEESHVLVWRELEPPLSIRPAPDGFVGLRTDAFISVGTGSLPMPSTFIHCGEGGLGNPTCSEASSRPG